MSGWVLMGLPAAAFSFGLSGGVWYMVGFLTCGAVNWFVIAKRSPPRQVVRLLITELLLSWALDLAWIRPAGCFFVRFSGLSLTRKTADTDRASECVDSAGLPGRSF